MKKTLALLLALAMSCTMLTACSEKDDKDSSSKADSSSVVDSSNVDPGTESSEPDSSEPDSSVPDSSEPDSSEPDSSEPDSSEPDSSEPDSSEPDSSEPDSSEPTSSEPNGPVSSNGIVFGDTIETSDRLFETLASELEKGACTMEMDVEEDGMAVYMYMTTDGKTTYVSMDFMGMAITMLTDDTTSYYLDEANKKYYSVPADPSNPTDELVDTDALTGENQEYISTGTVTVDGTEYTAEKYTIDGDEGYFVFNDAGDLCGIITVDPVSEETLFTPVVLKASAETDKLSLSSDYTAMTDEEFAAFMGVDMGSMQ